MHGARRPRGSYPGLLDLDGTAPTEPLLFCV
jgi:hypothetical protein